MRLLNQIHRGEEFCLSPQLRPEPGPHLHLQDMTRLNLTAKSETQTRPKALCNKLALVRQQNRTDVRSLSVGLCRCWFLEVSLVCQALLDLFHRKNVSSSPVLLLFSARFEGEFLRLNLGSAQEVSSRSSRGVGGRAVDHDSSRRRDVTSQETRLHRTQQEPVFHCHCIRMEQVL